MNVQKMVEAFKIIASTTGELSTALERRRIGTTKLHMIASNLDDAARKLREAASE
jgi:hypothetical protein